MVALHVVSIDKMLTEPEAANFGSAPSPLLPVKLVVHVWKS